MLEVAFQEYIHVLVMLTIGSDRLPVAVGRALQRHFAKALSTVVKTARWHLPSLYPIQTVPTLRVTWTSLAILANGTKSTTSQVKCLLQLSTGSDDTL